MKLGQIIGLILVGFVNAFTENQIIAKPAISCRDQGVAFETEVEQPFEGQLYVKGSRNYKNCWKKYEKSENHKIIGLEIDVRHLAMCGFSYVKKPGSSSKYIVSGHIVVSFHPSLVTSSDRAFSINCEFGNIVEPEKHQEVTTVFGSFKHQPEVSMTIKSQTKEEEEENSVFEIGQPLILKWELNKENEHGIFGISLDRCSAETSDGRGMRILENGCSLDEELISDSSTSSNNQKIMASSQAFKFPEEDIVFIRCHVRICIQRLPQFTSTTISADFCPKRRDCSDGLRNRRQSTNSTLLPITANFRIKPTSESLKKEEFQLCMAENLYYIGISSIVIMYILTFSTVLFMRKFS